MILVMFNVPYKSKTIQHRITSFSFYIYIQINTVEKFFDDVWKGKETCGFSLKVGFKNGNFTKFDVLILLWIMRK